MDQTKKKVGTCPKCGGDVNKNLKGYACECGFAISGIISNKRISDVEAQKLLEEKSLIVDFLNKDNRYYSSVLRITPSGEVTLNSAVGKCPRCGGTMYTGYRGFNCGNYANKENPCNFTIWRSISGHEISIKEVEQLCEDGFTTSPSEFYTESGDMYLRRLGLSPEKDKVVKL